jgi:uncharacterized protein (DUF58 family)
MHDRYGIVATVDELVRQRGTAGPLRLTPEGVVRTLQSGPFRSAYRGRGMEFDESRAYQPGDDVRAIDWRVTARTGRVHTKLYHEERERPVLLLVDARPRMRFGTRDCFKSVLAARTAATLAWAARDAGDRVGALVMTGTDTTPFPPHRGRARLLRLLEVLSKATADDGDLESVSLSEQIARLARVARPGTLVFILSDFHDFDDDAEKELARLSMHCDVVCIHVYDPLEVAAPESPGYRISDGERVLALAGFDRKWQREYRKGFETRRRRVESFCRRHGETFVSLRTGEEHGSTLASRLYPKRFRHASAARPAHGGASA